MEKVSSDYKKHTLHKGSFTNCSVKGYLGNQKMNISIKLSISELKSNIVLSLSLINNHLVYKDSLTDFD